MIRAHDQPRVAVVCAVDVSVQALLLPQIRGMQQAGYHVTAICSAGPLVSRLREGGLKILTVPISRAVTPAADLATLIRMVRIFRRERFDIVHTHTPKAAFLGQLAAWLARVPVRVNTIHGFYYLGETGRAARQVFKSLEVWACRLANHVFSQSQEDVEVALREGLISPDRLEWLGNGIDLSKFNPAGMPDDTRSLVRQELNIPPEAFVVGIVARMVREKGIIELFEAFARLRRSAPNAFLVHIGFVDASRNNQVVPAAAERFGIGEYCRFLGQRPDIARLLTAMDIYCLPSHREGYPRSVMEANAMGLPAVVTDIRGCREAVHDSVNGLLTPVNDPQALASAMLRLYQDGDLRQRLSRGALHRAGEAFDEHRVIRTILHRYELLLCQYGAKSRPGPTENRLPRG